MEALYSWSYSYCFSTQSKNYQTNCKMFCLIMIMNTKFHTDFNRIAKWTNWRKKIVRRTSTFNHFSEKWFGIKINPKHFGNDLTNALFKLFIVLLPRLFWKERFLLERKPKRIVQTDLEFFTQVVEIRDNWKTNDEYLLHFKHLKYISRNELEEVKTN